jgi:3-phenylpropionate/trans-cinnamate dioxygenase ferredoxin component
VPAGWVDVGEAATVTEADGLLAEVDGFAVLVVRCGDSLYAVEDRCTHDGEPLEGGEIGGCEIICPRHGSRFDLRSGEALTPPAYEPLRTFPVRVEQGRVLVEAPE